jgi:N-acetyl-gamma-glutamyl-phosphate reductase
MAYTCSVLGASGFSGGEVLAYLQRHPALVPVALGASKSAGEPVAALHPHLSGTPYGDLLPLAEARATPADVCFSCLPSGVLDPAAVAAERIVDLSDGFRADEEWTYGLTEFARDQVRESTRVANPGCYPTAALLALLPFARAGAIEGPVSIDALSGVSGAGREPADHLSLASMHGSAAAYGTTEHRHIPEMERSLRVWGGLDVYVSFTPHLAPMARGLLVTARASLVEDLDVEVALDVLRTAYADEPFVTVVEQWPTTKAVAGSNRALVTARVDARARFLIAHAVIDNLGKGAAGQAVQNANLMLGLEESTGLEGVGLWP